MKIDELIDRLQVIQHRKLKDHNGDPIEFRIDGTDGCISEGRTYVDMNIDFVLPSNYANFLVE